MPARRKGAGKAAESKAAESMADQIIEEALDDLEKRFGRGIAGTLRGKYAIRDTSAEVIPTRVLSLDIALTCGGLPRGRVVEVYGLEASGKTTLLLQAIAEAQAMGLTAAFIDAEHALDPHYAQALGIDLEKMLVVQPDNGEQALEIARTLVKSGAVHLIVIDSVAALTPKSELEGEIGDHSVGAHARLMSQALRILTSDVSKSGCCVAFINQMREKIGVTFGCFHYDSRVCLADGTTEKIGKIVNQKIPAEVVSYNTETGEFESRRIVDWHDNGPADSFLKFVCESPDGRNVRTNFKVTANHRLFLDDGTEVSAGDVQEGDTLLGEGEALLNYHQRDLAYAQVLGDGSVRQRGPRTQLHIGHGEDRAEYAMWKAGVFGDAVGWSNGSTHFNLKPSSDLLDIADTPLLIRNLRVLAIWCMDDGSFSGHYEKRGHGKFEISCARWTDRQKEVAVRQISKLLDGVEPTIRKRTLLFSGDRTRVLMEAIAPFVPKCMDYKIHPDFQHLCAAAKWGTEIWPRKVGVPIEVKSIEEVMSYPHPNRFDITVEGNHTYVVDGAVVHNSPKTTTGGKALKFYASVRIEVTRIGQIKEKEEQVGARTRIKVTKNKLGPPFRTVEVDLSFGSGFDRGAELLQLGLGLNILTKSGSHYSFEGKKLGQGRRVVIPKILEDQELCDRIVEGAKALYST